MAFLISRFIGAVPVSVVVDENHKSELEITSLPVEQGADITDHAYTKPKVITVHGVVGDGTNGFRGSFIEAAAYQALLTLQKSRTPFYLVTGISLYRDMLIESVLVDRTVDNSGVLEFTATLKQVKIIGSGFSASIINAVAGGQAAALAATTLAAGVIAQRASPSVRRGDNVVRAANTDTTTLEGRRNTAALARVGL